MPRVIAGKYKRTPLYTLEGEDITRPTRDMVKEALFSTITVYSDTVFLDLFAGSGAIGIEALSRGAADVIFNDSSRQAVGIIRKNLDRIHEERTVTQLDYEDCIRRYEAYGFDCIFCDPPYRFDEHEKLFSLIREHDLLKEDGMVILEAEKNTVLNERYGNMYLYKERRYGISKLLYYRKGEKEE